MVGGPPPHRLSTSIGTWQWRIELLRVLAYRRISSRRIICSQSPALLFSVNMISTICIMRSIVPDSKEKPEPSQKWYEKEAHVCLPLPRSQATLPSFQFAPRARQTQYRQTNLPPSHSRSSAFRTSRSPWITHEPKPHYILYPSGGAPVEPVPNSPPRLSSSATPALPLPFPPFPLPLPGTPSTCSRIIPPCVSLESAIRAC
jgi:hypothetical protein